jgi:thioesterase domain-containing protein
VRWMDDCFKADATPGEGEFGRARPGVEILVLDRHLQPSPRGGVGEIYVRAAGEAASRSLPGLARVEHPRKGSLFKTGDLARQRADGRIEWMGRADDQLSVHGLRVDTGEVEAALRGHPHVKAAAVLSRGAKDGERRLTAYIQSDSAAQAPFSPGRWRDFLRETLPEESIPADFVAVERFPLTADGRLDTAALPEATARSSPGAEEKENAPYLTIHYQLLDLWQQLLGVRLAGIRDDFFALGGNSLLAMRMLYRIEQIFGKALLPVTLFKQPTIEHLAAEMLKHEQDEPAAALVKINDQGSKTPIFYLHGDFHGGGFYSMKLSRHLGPDQPFYALPPAELTDPSMPPTIQEMAAMQIQCIREVRPHGPYVIGGFCLGGLIAFEVAQQLRNAGEVVERLLVIDATLKNRRLRRLRGAAELLGRWRGLSADRQLYLFCRWHFLHARFERWWHMAPRAKAGAVRRRLGGQWRHWTRRSALAKAAAAGNGGPAQPEVDWFDPRWDVPLVYLWSSGGYLPQPYNGPATVLLSRDLFRGRRQRELRVWTKYLGTPDVRELPGSHLGCITEHVDALAETIVRCLDQPPAA